MFPDYQKLVMLEYRKRRDANILPLSLMTPSPAMVKEECLRVCSERFDKRDEKVLREFFGVGSDKAACLKAIERCEIDRFRPLVNYLKKPSIKTGKIYIELLAWLIDFEDRPWELGRPYDVKAPEEKASRGRERIKAMEAGREKFVGGRTSRKIIVVVVFVALVGVGTYWIWGSVHSGSCMVWTGDRYEAVSCGHQAGDTPVIPLDAEKLTHFRKITRLDTITENALGFVWYAKFRGGFECYTADGYHPLDSSLRLKLLTDYVLRRYIRPGWDPDSAKGLR
jgi:hypothetical protein